MDIDQPVQSLPVNRIHHNHILLFEDPLQPHFDLIATIPGSSFPSLHASVLFHRHLVLVRAISCLVVVLVSALSHRPFLSAEEVQPGAGFLHLVWVGDPV